MLKTTSKVINKTTTITGEE
jgi:hypothetical protein